MPTYEYKCETCGHHFEKFQSMKDDPLRTCPECGGQVRRLLGTGAAVIFKGAGFYETDYKRQRSVPSTRCGRGSPCCGRDEPCERPPCTD